jgi:hypothetical protein
MNLTETCRDQRCCRPHGHGSLRAELRPRGPVDPHPRLGLPGDPRGAGTADENCSGAAAEFVRNHTTEARDIMNAGADARPGGIHLRHRGELDAHAADERRAGPSAERSDRAVRREHPRQPEDHHRRRRHGDRLHGELAAPLRAYRRSGTGRRRRRSLDLRRGSGSCRGDPRGGHHGTPDRREHARSGWNIGEMFNIVYMAHGGEFFEPGTAIPAVNSEAGVATLEMMARWPNTPIPTTSARPPTRPRPRGRPVRPHLASCGVRAGR